jgi:hypothetical protein
MSKVANRHSRPMVVGCGRLLSRSSAWKSFAFNHELAGLLKLGGYVAA